MEISVTTTRTKKRRISLDEISATIDANYDKIRAPIEAVVRELEAKGENAYRCVWILDNSLLVGDAGKSRKFNASQIPREPLTQLALRLQKDITTKHEDARLWIALSPYVDDLVSFGVMFQTDRDDVLYDCTSHVSPALKQHLDLLEEAFDKHEKYTLICGDSETTLEVDYTADQVNEQLIHRFRLVSVQVVLVDTTKANGSADEAPRMITFFHWDRTKRNY